MTQSASLKNEIDTRFNLLTLSSKLARQHTGQEPKPIAFEYTEQSDARRQLLRIEKQAIKDKQLNLRSHQNFVASISQMVHDEIAQQMIQSVANTDQLFHDVLGFDNRLPELLDALSVRASSIAKLEPLAANIPWLYDELIRLINSPKYRRVDARGKVVTVESLKVALSFLGIENLKMLVPMIAFRRCLPQITDPFPEIKTRLLETAVGTAMSAKKIAQVSEVDQYHGFLAGLFHDLGKLVVVRLYFKLFDQVHREAVVEAQNERKREEHVALSEVEPSSDFLIEMLNKHAYPLSASFIQKMPFKRLQFAPAVNEFSENLAISQMSPLAKTLTQAVAYNRYRMLKQNKMIDVPEAKEFLRQFYFPKGSLAVLKTTDLRELDIVMDS